MFLFQFICFSILFVLLFFFFFFQAEDGIRDLIVTGVQTCALPIFCGDEAALGEQLYELWIKGLEKLLAERGLIAADELDAGRMLHPAPPLDRVLRSEERRVGEECRSRWSRYH